MMIFGFLFGASLLIFGFALIKIHKQRQNAKANTGDKE